jgi:LPS-assembly protein
MKHDQALPAGFTGKLDLDVVSDQDYLQEFKTGYTGFEQSRDEFLDTFGREIDEFTDTTRVNRLNLNRIWPTYSLNAETRWYDDVVKRQYGDTDDTLQKLPFVTFNGSRQPLLDTPAYFDFETEYVRFYRIEGDRGQRIDLYPRFYFPWRYQHFAAVEPSFGLRETVWNVDHEQEPDPELNLTAHRESYDLKLDVSSEIYRVFSSGWEGVDRIQHQIRPQVVYEYIPDQDQSDLPQFDGTDRINKRNRITYSLINTLISRSPVKPPAAPDAEADNPPDEVGDLAIETPAGAGEEAEKGPGYREFLRLRLLQYYDINEANEEDPQPFSPIQAELELNPSSFITFKADGQWSIYDSAFVSHNLSARLEDPRGDQLIAEYRYTRDSKESIIVEALIPVTDSISLSGDFEENLFDNEILKTGVGVLYKSQCWSVDVKYEEEGDDKSISFMVSLHGLGAMGTGVGVGGE